MKYMLAEVEVPFRVAIMGTIFLVFFVSMMVFVYRRSRKERYESIGKLPLDDGIEVESDMVETEKGTI